MREALSGIVQGGKRVRPLLALLSASAAGGREEDALDAATALELLHASSLIHDDIMDHSPLRRGRPAIHTHYGVPMAVLAGDTLIALAFRTIHSTTSSQKHLMVQEFTTAFLELCEGQSLDLFLGQTDAVDTTNHRKMVECKTAKLFESAAVIGGLAATADPFVIRSLRSFGQNIGMAYQAKDDLLDVVGMEHLLGKPTGADERNGKHTYLKLANPYKTDNSTIAVAVDNVSATVRQYTERAILALNGLPATAAQEQLRGFAVSLAERSS
jgi:geranylgeranyl pyrophosphate synthase